MHGEDPCTDELRVVVAAFTRRGTVEPGLDVEGEALLQLQKACRILNGIRAVLRDRPRVAESNDLHAHADTFEYGVKASAFSQRTRTQL